MSSNKPSKSERFRAKTARGEPNHAEPCPPNLRSADRNLVITGALAHAATSSRVYLSVSILKELDNRMQSGKEQESFRENSQHRRSFQFAS